jgi:hypothetical protein
MAVGIGLRLQSGERVRFRLSLDDCRHLAETLMESVNAAAASRQDRQDSQPSAGCPTDHAR